MSEIDTFMSDSAEFRVVVLEHQGREPGKLRGLSTSLMSGESATIGREGDLPLGLAPEDLGVSRVAITVTATPGGWALTVSNRNGAWICPWGLESQRVLAISPPVMLAWPLVGVRVVGKLRDWQHWILLECAAFRRPRLDRQASWAPSEFTDSDVPPSDLTRPQLEAVLTVFRDYFVWPPHANPQPIAQEAAAKRLGISSNGLAQRLEGVALKARRLSGHQQIGVADPGYVHVLVEHGYIDPPTAQISADRLR